MSKHNIKLGVTLYSFSSEYMNEKLTLEEILAKVKKMGYEGIEIVPAQMSPTYPYITDEWIDELKRLLEKYKLKPICWSAYVDKGLTTGYDLTEEQVFQYTLNDMIYAKKAGFPIVRTQHSITPEIFKKMIPYCKELGMKLTIEMHHPHHPEIEEWKEYIALMKGEGKGYLGLVPDFGIFQNHPHKLYIDQALELGFREDKLKEVIRLHGLDTPIEKVLDELTEKEIEITKELYWTFNHPAKPEQLKELIDVCFYMHGKFYYANEGEDDHCIPYKEILETVADLGYNGYIACEYEGHHFTDELDAAEQLQRYVDMNKRILGL